MNAVRVLDCKNEHGEGILWNSQDAKVWWTDIEGRAIWSFDPLNNASQKFHMPNRVCCFAFRKQGGLIVAFDNRISLYDLATGKEDRICDYQPGNAETRLNDGRTDRQGRFILGGMNEKTGAADASVLRIDPDLSVHGLFDGVACSNSTCFSSDGRTMYFADTPDRKIVAWDYDIETGQISRKRTHLDMTNEPGLPDGSCVDAEGGVWNAQWEGGRVIRISPDGAIDKVIELPVSKPTCCAFGGKDLDTLFITTSRLNSNEEMLAEEPDSGGLFSVKPGFIGLVDTPFSG